MQETAQETAQVGGFLFRCGCAAETVGQAFVRGVLVCPVHGEPPGPGPGVEQPWRGRATITLRLEAPDHEAGAVLVDAVLERLLELDYVTGIDSSLEHLQ